MAGNIKGITVEIGGNTAPLDKSLKDVNKTSRDLQGELREVNRQLKLDPTNTTLLAQKQKLLAESVTTTKGKLETLKEAERQAQEQFKQGKISEEQYRALQREVIKTEQQLKNLESQASKSNVTLSKISETAGKVGDAAGKIGDKMMPATVAIAGVGVAAGKMSIDFENSVAKVSTISNESEVSIGDLRKGILKLSNDTGIASTEIANNVYDAISAGQKTGDAVNFVSNSTKLAKAGFAEAGQSLDLLTTILNSYGMEASEVTKVSDILINTQNKGKVTVGELSSSMGKVVPTAKAFGVNLEQVATGYAIMTAKGIKAAETTTYMNSMFNEMGKTGTKASDTIKEVAGKSFQELIQEGKSVGDVLALMKDHADKNSLSLADMFGSAEAGKAALILSNNAGQDFNNMLKDMNNTADATDEAFDKVSNTTGEKLKKSLNQLKNDGIILGDSIAPIIEKISNLAGILAQKIATLSQGQLDMIVNIGLIIAAIAPAAKVIQGISIVIGGATTVISTISAAIGLLTGTLTVASPAATALAGAITFITGPIGITIIAITALVAGVLYLWNHCEAFRLFWLNLWESIKSIASAVVDALIIFFTITIPEAWNGLVTFFQGIPQWFSNLWIQVKDATEIVWENIKMIFLNVWNSIVSIVMSIITPFLDGVMILFNLFKDGISIILTGLKDFFIGIWEVIKNIFLGAILLIIDLVTGDFTKLKADTEGIFNNLKAAFSQIWEGIKEIFTGVVTAISNFLTATWNGIVIIATTIWNGLKDFFSNLWISIKSLAESAWNGVKSVVVSITEGIKDSVINIWNSIIDFFKSLPTTLYNLGSNIFYNLKNGIGSVLDTLGSYIINGFNSAIKFITSLPSQAVTWGKDFIQGLIDGIKSMIGGVVDAVASVGERIRNFLHFSVPDEGPLTDYETWMPDFMDGLAKGIKNSKYLVTDAIKDLSTDMSVGVYGNMLNTDKNIQTEKDLNDSIGGNTFIFNSPKALDEVEASRQFRRAQRELAIL